MSLNVHIIFVKLSGIFSRFLKILETNFWKFLENYEIFEDILWKLWKNCGTVAVKFWGQVWENLKNITRNKLSWEKN